MLDEADKARALGKQVVLVHHNIVQHHDAQATLQSAYIIEDYVNVSKQLMKHGIHMAFTGHTHLQNIAQYRTITTKAQPDSLVVVSTGSVLYSSKDWSFNQILAYLWSFLSISAFVPIIFCNFAVKQQ